MPNLTDIARRTAERHDLLPAGAPVLAMVSGGADSVALLLLLAQRVFGELPLRVLHVNHLLRGADSDADEEFVRGLGERLGIETRVVRYDVAAYATEGGLNLEDAGRRVRYRFAEEELDAFCRETGVRTDRGRIAVAHTLDDRVETFFMRALYGAGAGGLASIAPVRGRIVRPLLGAGRAAIREWLERSGESWREDATNDDTARLRARVRAKLVPAAERINPVFREALERSMDLLATDDALLSSMADAFSRDFAQIVPQERIEFDRDLMLTLDRTMARRTVRSALLRAFPDSSRIEAEHVETLVDGLADPGFAHDLPGGLRAYGEYDSMVISCANETCSTVAPSLLVVPGTTELGDAGKIVAEIAEPGDTSGTAESVVIDAGHVLGELIVDSPRPGDRMRPLGMEGTRKVSDLLVDAKVPKRARAATPVVRDGERIVWLAGVRMSDDYRVGPRTQRSVRLTWRRD